MDPLAGPRRRRSQFAVLVVEDDPSDTELLLHAIEKAELKAGEGDLHFEVRATAEGAVKVLAEQPVDLVLTDMMLPGMDGLDLVSRIQELDRNLPVLVITRLGGVDTAVEAMRRGAFDYILKPVNPTDLGMRLHRAIRFSEILRRNSAFERTMRQRVEAGSFVGVSKAYQEVVRLIREAAQVRSTVLIMGETGTGKGLIARAIHEQSREREKPYQVVDCATMPEGMVESELFGHIRGAFTGAVADKPGLIELANQGTLFLDEIGEIPPALQAKLLRVLEDNEVRPVGGTRVKRVDLRVIAATNQDLDHKVHEGTFRKDLFYRLAVIVIRVPPLRERLEDIPVIARQLVTQFGREMGKPRCYLDPSGMAELTGYAWPGNVRELRNILERAVMLSTSESIGGDDIRALVPTGKNAGASVDLASYAALPYTQAKQKALADFTSAYLREKLAIHGGHITKAAEDSRIPRQHFSLLLKRFLDRTGSGKS
ncbi:MAG: sigma-54-dependent transcriptional regulator [Nitrospirales bacterium]